MLYLQEPSQVICLVLHQPNKATVNRFRSITRVSFILELAFLVSVQLVFIHWKRQSIHQRLYVLIHTRRHLLSNYAAGGFVKCGLVYCQKLVSCVDIAKTEQVAVHEFKAVTFTCLVVRILKYFFQIDLLDGAWLLVVKES